jgi:hypothetical protein
LSTGGNFFRMNRSRQWTAVPSGTAEPYSVRLYGLLFSGADGFTMQFDGGALEVAFLGHSVKESKLHKKLLKAGGGAGSATRNGRPERVVCLAASMGGSGASEHSLLSEKTDVSSLD